MQSAIPWGGLFLLACFLIVMGFQGSAGKMIAVMFTPRELDVFPTGFTVTPGGPSGYGGQGSGYFGPPPTGVTNG